MSLSTLSRAAAALLCAATPLLAQAQIGDAPLIERAAALHLKAGVYDPVNETLKIPAFLRSSAQTGLWVVQFANTPTEDWRERVRMLGGEIHQYLPDNAYVVRMDSRIASAVAGLPFVRHLGAYEPAFRLDPMLTTALTNGRILGERRYNVVVVDKRQDKPALIQTIGDLGGRVENALEDSILMEVTLNDQQLIAVAGLDQVLWIDLWSAPEEDMDNARIQGGANYIESVAGYTGSGINAHVYEGVEANHPDFTTPMTRVGPASCGAAASHGHATAGIVLGNGTSDPRARGMAPDARGFYTTYVSTSNSCATSRNSILGTAVNTNQVMLTTASWGNARTTAYTSNSAAADDVVFDHRIPWTQSQSNAGNQQSRPQAWGKNIISVGGIDHNDNSNPNDDSWAGGNASTGPAADGRIKPDLCAYYDSIFTSDRTGTAGYTNGSSYASFGGTSGATPIVAGHNALAIQMYTDGLFGSNTIRVPGGSRFQNRPYAQTLKALMIATANQYQFNASSSDNRREHQGWGFPSLRNLYDNRNEIFIVPEDNPLTQGQTESYNIRVVPGEDRLKICMSFLEPAGNPAATQAIVNDLTLKVTSPTGTVYWGNNGLENGIQSVSGGSADTRDSVENVILANPIAGDWTVEVIATRVVTDAHISTGATDATYALAVNGGVLALGAPCESFQINNNAGEGISNVIPFGGAFPVALESIYAANNGGAVGGAVYFDVTTSQSIRLQTIAVNTNIVDAPISCEVFVTAQGGSSLASQANAADWRSLGFASGIAAGEDNKSVLTMDTPQVLPSGTYGVALVARNFNHRYTNGNGTNQSYNDSTLQIDLGTASNVPFTSPFFDPRVANVEFGYLRVASSGLETIFVSNNGGSTGGANYFDVSGDEILTIDGISVNTARAAGTNLTLAIYTAPEGTSYSGNETNAGLWTRVATATGVATGQDMQSQLTLNRGIVFNPNSASGTTQGFAIVAEDFAFRYTNGTGANQSYSDGTIQLDLGSATNVPFVGSPFNPRVANIRVSYAQLPDRYNSNVRFQQLIDSSRIDQTGAITGLAFAATGSGEMRFDDLTIRMSELPAGSTLSSTFAANLSSPVQVFESAGIFGPVQHVWPINEESWMEIGLQVPFNYSGGDLVIEVIARGRDAVVNTGGFRRAPTGQPIPRVWSENWTTLPASGSTSSSGLRTRLDFGCNSIARFGLNCGDLETHATGDASLGAAFDLISGVGLAGAPTVLHVGADNSSIYPLTLSGIGAPDCFFHCDALVAFSQVADSNGSTTLNVPVQTSPSLTGLNLYAQHLQLNASQPGGVSAAGYARITLGEPR